MKTKRKISVTVSAALCIIISLCMYLIVPRYFSDNTKDKSKNDNELISHYIDVGQGDSEFIEFPDGKTMLIDAGTDKYGETVADYIKKLGYSKIDYLVGTHPHADHIGGMADVIEEFDIGSIYMPKASTNTKTFENLLLAVQEKGMTINTAKTGINILSSKENDYSADILSPSGSEYDDLNNYSVVIKITYGDSKFLYMGDAEKEIENELIDSGADVKADVIKVGHHGSNTSSSSDFVKAVGADYAVFSVGKDNDYGHPHSQTVKRWKNIGAEIYRTDEQGTIIISSNGSDITANAA